MAMMVQMADGGGSGKKKEKTPATIVTPSGKVIKPTTTTPTTGGSTTHVSSSGNVHGGSSGSFGGTPTSTSGGGGNNPVASTIQNGVAAAAQAVKNAAAAAAQAAAATPQASGGSRSSGGSGGGSSSSGSGSTAASGGGSSVQVDNSLPQFQEPTGDPVLKQKYETAMATLEGMKGKAPVYSSQYDEQIKSLYEQITGRAPFRYDSATDPLYQQYRQSYIAEGGRAMRDTMGQAAALTGGYGSSYAQSVGQQAYDRYLERLADILPETYGLALDAYNAEGDRLDKELAMTQAMEKSDYDRYLDSLNKHYKDLSLAQDEADAAYSRMIYGDETAYSRSMDAYKRQLTENDIEYSRRNDYYNRLVSLMGAGYKPTAEDYAMAGITPSQGAVIRQRYLDSIAPASSGGGYVSKKSTDTSASDNAFIEALANYLGGGSTKSTTSGTTKRGTSSSSSSGTSSSSSSSSTTTKKKTYGNGGR